MEEITNPIISNEPPFATAEEVSLVNPIRPKGVSNQSWEKYMQVFNFAKLKGDPDPNKKAQEAAMNTNWFKKTNGKNNLFNTTVGKSEPGTVKGNEKFKNYSSILDSVNELYNTQALQTPIQNSAQEEIPNELQTIDVPQQQTIGSTQPVNIDQSYAQPIMNNFELPQQSNMTGKVASDMNLSNNTLSPNQYLQSNNPKEGNNSFAYGGNLDQNPPKKRKPTYQDSLDAYNKGEKEKKVGSRILPFDKNDIQDGNMTDSDGGIYKRTGILPTKEYVKGDYYSYGYDKPKGNELTMKKTLTSLQKRDKQIPLNLKSNDIKETVNETPISNNVLKETYNVPKSYNISEINNRMNNSTGYGSGRTDNDADINKALRAQESADRYNKSIELKYNNADVQNNPKALERYKTLKNNVTINPNVFSNGGNMNETYNSDFDTFDVGGSHSENPLGGIPMGMGQNGQMNTVEEGETSFMINKQKFIFSDRIKI